MALVAKVAVSAAPYSIDRPYDYLVPEELEPTLRPGMRCAVPFGRGNQMRDAIVLQVTRAEELSAKLKRILAQLDDVPMLSQEDLQLALWMREQYFCTVYDAARAMLPAGLWFSLRDGWKLAPGVDREAAYAAAGSSKHARHLVELLLANRGSAELGQIRMAFGTASPNQALQQLQCAGILIRETSAARGVGDKTEKIAALAVPPEDAVSYAQTRCRRAPMQYQVIQTLCATGRVSAKELCYFTGASMSTLKSLEKAGILTLEKQEVSRRPQLPEVEPAPVPVLNEEQENAYERLLALSGTGKAEAALLYGVTGRGKTLVYIRLIHTLLERGKSALVLVPEIALTPQLMRVFLSHFGEQVAILHSGLSGAERCDEWKRVRGGKARVVVGTRSAVFAPVSDLGVLILDEEQEPAYKSEQTPRYHARDVAKYRCYKSGALLVMGSATPSVESMYHAVKGDYHLLRMEQRYNARQLPQVDIVDMKQELRDGNGSCISRRLEQALRETAGRGEQAILFLNRRGANRMVSCGECGAVPTCPRCSVYLTYHSANHRLMCHYCGHSEPLPDRCPHCGGLLNFIGTGTQKAEEELHRKLPDLAVLRMDMDTVSATNSHEAILEQFRTKRIPILLGTQMVAKGLDFDNVTLVGALDADQMLYVEDFRAGERTFSLLTQVVGRSGRGSKTGRAVIQTYTPENDVIQCAARQDYDTFYAGEIRMRQVRFFPPFSDLFVLGVTGLEETAVLNACMKLRDGLDRALQQPPYQQGQYRLLGPAPAAVAKVNDRYRYRITLSARNSRAIRLLVAHLIRQAQSDKANRGLTIFADLNPMG